MVFRFDGLKKMWIEFIFSFLFAIILFVSICGNILILIILGKSIFRIRHVSFFLVFISFILSAIIFLFCSIKQKLISHIFNLFGGFSQLSQILTLKTQFSNLDQSETIPGVMSAPIKILTFSRFDIHWKHWYKQTNKQTNKKTNEHPNNQTLQNQKRTMIFMFVVYVVLKLWTLKP